MRGAEVRGAATLAELVASPARPGAAGRAPAAAGRPADAPAPRPTWPTCGARPLGRRAARGGRGRAPPPPHGRAARLGQDDAGRAPAGPAARRSRPPRRSTVTRIHSAAGCAAARGDRWSTRPPFRAPHHQASIVSLVGGGSWSLRPGEVSLATHGVLFLDELGEFPVAALEALRQPLEEGVIRVSRAGGTVTFPAAFLLVAAMNPCPCGEGVYEGACSCTEAARARYRRRLSAPLLDRFDLIVPLSRPDPDELLAGEPGESRPPSSARRVAAARAGRPRPWPARRRAAAAADAAALLASKLRAGALSARGLHKVTASGPHGGRPGRRRRRVVRPCVRGTVAARRPVRWWWRERRRESGLPEEAFAAALASMPTIGPATSARAVGGRPALGGLGAGQWRRPRRARSLAVWQRHEESASRCSWPERRRTRPGCRDDPQAPAVLFCLGDPAVLSGARRWRWSGPGARPATASAWRRSSGPTSPPPGVSVVSGLALGIDGAAHEGACGAGAPPIAVVAGGLDDPYPRRHERLWERVAATGAIVSESPAGVPHREVALPGAQPAPRRAERRRGRGREPPPRGIAPHRRCRRRTVASRSAPCPAPSAARPRRAPTRCWRTAASRCARRATSWWRSRSAAPWCTCPATSTAAGGRAAPRPPPGDRDRPRLYDALSRRPHLPRRPGPADRPRPGRAVRWPRAAGPGRPGPRRRGMVGTGLSLG